jgi:hypothetical protein
MREIWYFNKYKILLKKQVSTCNTCSNIWNVSLLFKRCVRMRLTVKQWLSGRCSNSWWTLSLGNTHGIRISDLALMIFSLLFFFFSPSSLIYGLKPLKFQSSLSICFRFRFDQCSFDYYLFYLKWFIKLNFFYFILLQFFNLSYLVPIFFLLLLILFWIIFLIDFFFNFDPRHFILFYFCIKFDLYSFKCYLFYFDKFFILKYFFSNFIL